MAGQDDETVPGLTLEPKLEAKLDSLDDHLQPISKDLKDDKGSEESEAQSQEDTKGESAAEQTPEKDESVQSDESGAEEDSSGEGTTGEESDGYTIDEGDEDSEEVPSNSTAEQSTSQLTPEEQYIVDNIPTFKVQGYLPGSEKLETIDIRTIEQLPHGFKYASDQESALAATRTAMNENRALQLQTEYRNQQSQKAATEFKEREDRADRQDIAELQREGKIPRFKVDPNSKDFESDPGVQLVQEILDYKETQNNKYMEEYNAGRPYKHIGFDEAFRMYQRDNPTKGNPAQVKEDAERKGIAKRTSGTTGSTATKEAPKTRAHSGMTSLDLENLIESKTAGW